MVWIAGGGFFALGGTVTVFGPHYLMDKDVVVVSFNYRLGILGTRHIAVGPHAKSR